MTKHLYDIFKHWYHGGSIYFYSDPHFSDEEMKYLRKNYLGDEEQVKSINKVLGKNDALVILGDIGNTDFVRKLRGYKVLVCGNHDVGASKYKREIIKEVYDRTSLTYKEVLEIVKEKYPKCKYDIYEEVDIHHSPFDIWIAEIDNCLFDEVYEGPLMISEKMVLSHEPLYFPFALNIHGHDHSKTSFQDDKHINVCAENINYTPICIKEIVTSGKLNKIDSIHRATIDRATEKNRLKHDKN